MSDLIRASENETEQKEKRRDYDVNDERWFSKDAVVLLQRAQEEIVWLLDRNYKISTIIELVGGHYQLSARQRIALQRACCTSKQNECRRQKLQSLQAAKKNILYIDGFNLIITLEVALSNSILIMGSDGCIRDIAGLRGTYRLIDKTQGALELIGRALNELEIPYCKFYLDSPVSNSGRLKSAILEHAENWGMEIEVELVQNPDNILFNLDHVVTSDSVILDNCISWVNLSGKIIEEYVQDVRIIDLRSKHSGNELPHEIT